jgi:hypothetical protein
MNIITAPAYPQFGSQQQPLALHPKYSKLQFTQDLNIFDWVYTFNFQKQLNNGLAINVNERYHATLQSLSFQDRWKDNQDLSLSLSYPLTRALTVTNDFTSHVLSDPLAGFDNDVTFHSGSAGLVYQPSGHGFLSPKMSSKWQTQVERRDHGYGMGIDARLFNLEFDGYQSDLWAFGERDFFPERKNSDLSLRYEIRRTFHESTTDTLIVFLNQLRRDSFDAAGDEIFVRSLSQSNRGFENRLRYQIAPDVSLFVRNSISSDVFEVQNLREDATDVRKDDAGFESKHVLQVGISKTRWTSNISWNLRTRSLDDRRPQESIIDPFGSRHPSLGFDTDESFTNWQLRSGYQISDSDSLGLFAAASKFQFDTSDTTNPNDHDQLRWQVTVSHKHQFGKALSITWRASAFLNHFVYISRKLSSGNNWERVFQLSPQITYRPSARFSFRQGFTVRAKYQTYDFDESETSNRNIVNRQFVVSNSSQYVFSNALSLVMTFNLELAEQGKLFYDLWRQRLALSWQNQEVQIQLRHKVGHKFSIKPGARLFHQTRWNHSVLSDGTSVKLVRDKHTNIGPTLQVSYRPSPSVEFAFLGNIQVVSSSGRPAEHLNNFDVNLNWFF